MDCWSHLWRLSYLFLKFLGHCEEALLIFIAYYPILVRALPITNIFHGYCTWFKKCHLEILPASRDYPIAIYFRYHKANVCRCLYFVFFLQRPLPLSSIFLLVSGEIYAKLLRISDDFPVMYDKYDELFEISLCSEFSNVNGVPQSLGACAIVRRSSR